MTDKTNNTALRQVFLRMVGQYPYILGKYEEIYGNKLQIYDIGYRKAYGLWL